jgi:type I restriction enzyme S subunit
MLKTERTMSIWPTVHLGALFKLSSGSTKPDDLAEEQCVERPYPVYGGNGVMGYSAQANVNGLNIVIGRVGANCGCVHLVEGKSWITDNALYTASKLVEYDDAFLSELLSYLRLDRLRGQSGQPLVTQEPIHSLKTLLPPLPEQRKIAEILRAWDEAIENLKALLAVKEHQLEGLAARLIHKAQAEPQHLREHLNEVSERNKGQNVNRILSVTNSVGFVLAEDQFAHRVASADTSNYKIVRRGQYAYNPSRINVGSIARLDNWPEGALSPMYVVFEVLDTLDTDFFGHWLRSAEARNRIALAAQGSVRDTVSFGDLGSILVPLPSLDEQRRIARALTTANDELSLLGDEITALTRQKRGLMQKLLTGEWRVRTEDAGVA